MTRRRILASALAAVAAVTMVVPAAFAGGSAGLGGAWANGPLPHYKCYVVFGGDDPAFVVDLVDQFSRIDGEGNAIPDRVRVGRAVLVCPAVTKIVRQCPGGDATTVPPTPCTEPSASPEDADHYTCYAMERNRGAFDNPNVTVDLINQFTGAGADRVRVLTSAVLCTPTIKVPVE